MRRSQPLPEDVSINKQVILPLMRPNSNPSFLSSRIVQLAAQLYKVSPGDVADINGIGTLFEVENSEPTFLISKDNVIARSHFGLGNFLPEFSRINPFVS